MRLITLDRCQPGVKLGKSLYHENGRVLLNQGTELTTNLINKLEEYSIFTIYIEDEVSEGIEIVEAIPETLRAEAVNVITDGLDTIAGLSTANSNIQGMMKSGRAIRSFQKIFRDILSCLNGNQMALNLLASTKIHENYVYTHSLNVTIYTCQLALENGLPLKNIEEIGLGAMLHDLGKMYISPQILNKPGKLTKEEFEQVKAHSELGFELLRKIHEIPLPVAHCALQHHERIDGTGYPRGLKDEEIHKYAKIISVADVFDAVTTHRVYRSSMLPHKGLELLYAGSGTQFESKQVELFSNCIAIYPQGLTVKLNDGRTGIVSQYNFNAVGRPVIRIFSDEEQQEISPYEIDLSANEHLTVEIVEADALL
ncbi:HD-GYP domain-containing protein [Halalkalibacter nanhaiisediminis]|uniref:Putative nucleotidyltransferase with HDIG domain n=1 Tax=Halalkalibacter nanhaiisediminis TaxID=688079 RepID=A0A562QSK4_9BACI|nr:HD-GYP domain-containing protein [Halalkalibacter nanhaiisediminis]TWI59066.1 putative nucleotidyltransferase with HDIG domain [Halalkalibacter nanhaiisediminis]